MFLTLQYFVDIVFDVLYVVDERDAATTDGDGFVTDDAPERTDAGAERFDSSYDETLQRNSAFLLQTKMLPITRN